MNESEQEAGLELAVPPGGTAIVSFARGLDRFNGWVVAALIIHAAVLAGMIRYQPRQLGDPSGMDGAISVSLITEAELRGNATVADEAPGAAAAPPPPSVSAPELRPQIDESAASPAERMRADEPAPTQAQEKSTTETPSLEEPTIDPKAVDEILKGTKPPETPRAEKQQEKQAALKPATPAETKKVEKSSKPKETKTAKLDLAMPPAMAAAPPGSRGAGVERPPGITRSGENDMFARNVIRALQSTMPQLRDTRGRVRVRITLDRNGNLVSTQVLMPSQVAGLDQSVVFATRQTSFPLPPNNATPADLVFVVTYIYR